METQRQWAERAISRVTPALLGLFSWVTLVAHHLQQARPMPVRQAAWYVKERPTFADALAWVRQALWPCAFFDTSPSGGDMVKLPKSLLDQLLDTVCYAT
ncbi:MAG: hypothetical protein KJZ93_32640 [Caldilineaceae bacterium]|nr:hypothetical protein [Caldilineaceae bacterium]